MPVYNGEKYLLEAINSILRQSFKEFELIIINDGSTDGSKEILKSINDERILFYENSKNLGIVDTLNFGLKAASGKYIARMDCDDISEPNRLELQYKYLEANDNVGIIGTRVVIFNNKNEIVSRAERPYLNNHIKWLLIYDCPIIHPSVMFRRLLVKNYGSYSKEFMHAEDYEFFSRLIKKTDFYQLPDTLVRLRRHGSNIGVVYSALQKLSHGLITKRNLRDLTTFSELEIEKATTIFTDYKISSFEHFNLIRKIFNCFSNEYFLTSKEKNKIFEEIACITLRVCKHNTLIINLRIIFKWVLNLFSLNNYYFYLAYYILKYLYNNMKTAVR